MKGATRLLTGAVISALAIAALRLPAPRPGRPGELLSRRWFQQDTLGRGETLSELLVRRGLSASEASAILAATTLDFPAICGVSLLIAATYVIVNLLIDLLYCVIDPRIRYQ